MSARLWSLVAAAGLLAGCAGQLQLLENGRTYPGSFNSASGTAEATIDGIHYTGTFRNPPPIGLGIGVGGGSWGGSFGGVGLSTGTGGGGGYALLRSPDGSRVIECYFSTSFGSGQGQCMGPDGRRFILVVGGG
ncbi:hypothetical protein [Variovorax sp. OV329]|uniref:hypothetical protein n=1 Tax=Variovorax sp. OV329 TaxID=1882825 RepID=UPI0011139E5B|nr:hypothetical protein [Variovorax sp. OV329]